jgi:hypothetical protein
VKKLRPELPLARYSFEGDVRSDGSPRWNMFKPRKGDALSVFDIEGMTHQDACEHGHKHTDNPAIGCVHNGYASLEYSVYQMLDLSGTYDNDPPRHVSISLPDADEARREIAKALAGEVNAIEHCE